MNRPVIAVIIFNLGGPDSLPKVRDFLQELFSDPYIIRLPGYIRKPLAKFIAKRREKKAQEIYKKIGGKSPILEQTNQQAEKLKKYLLEKHPNMDWQIFPVMRYASPRAHEVAKILKKHHPEEILLLPLYPQYSTTTSLSSLREWSRETLKPEHDHFFVNIKTRFSCCYFDSEDFIKAHLERIKEACGENIFSSQFLSETRFLFSAHGLPEKIIKQGDPYQNQIEKNTKLIVEKLQNFLQENAIIHTLDTQVCYQSRVGPLKWLGPATEDEIIRAGKDKKNIVLIPIAFVSEHSETLVELDIEYQELAHAHGVKKYIRVFTVSDHPDFIAALGKECFKMLNDPSGGIGSKSECCQEKVGCLFYTDKR